MNGLEALKRIYEMSYGTVNDYEVVKKSLKALEIIKKIIKDSDSNSGIKITFKDSCLDNYIGYISVKSSNGDWGDFYFEIFPQTKEEYDLLKEVLRND